MCINFGGAILCGDHPVYEIEVKGKKILFKHHPFLGITPCKKDGSDRSLADSHPFWKAVSGKSEFKRWDRRNDGK